MSKTLVELGPAQEAIIAELTHAGIFKTKAEVIRAGINHLSKEYGSPDWKMRIKQITDPHALEKIQKIKDDIKSGRVKTVSMEDVRKKYPHLPFP